MRPGVDPDQVVALEEAFGAKLQKDVVLAPYTSARMGGPADAVLSVRSSQELADAARQLWALDMPFRVLGGGSNVLVADAGVRGVVMLNQAKRVRFEPGPEGPLAWAESGASLGTVARRTVERGWSGLEWAATVPGSVGGAIVGNAGAHGSDTASCLHLAEILQRNGRTAEWTAKSLEFAYRTSWLKRHPGEALVLAATFALRPASTEATKARMGEFLAHRRATQPAGASLGSMFKNPPGDYAGRLIEAAGLKGLKRGQAQISRVHANFFVNLGDARAEDVLHLIETARRRVHEEFDIALELEIELVGEWEPRLANPLTGRQAKA